MAIALAPQKLRLWGALAGTLGQCSVPACARPLSASARGDLERWRLDRWRRLESRAGALAPRDASAWYELLAFERWRTRRPPRALPANALSLFYSVKSMVPRGVQIALRRWLAGYQGNPRFPEWPFERAGRDLLEIALADLLLEAGVETMCFSWFWPDGADAATLLTHDVESEQGLAYAPTVAQWEERHGFRSSFNIVGEWYKVDVGVVRELAHRGHEIGSHGIYHDASLFSSRAEFDRQLPKLHACARQLGAVGFRSPSTHRIVEWLAELPFSYDCTMPHSDPYEPIPGGTATIWPFFHGDVVEIPYTAPQDHTLFTVLQHTDSSLWRDQLLRIVDGHGVFQMLTHPDPDCLGRAVAGRAYRDLLARIADTTGLWVPLPRELARWWRGRAGGETAAMKGVAAWDGSTVEYGPGPVDHGG